MRQGHKMKLFARTKHPSIIFLWSHNLIIAIIFISHHHAILVTTGQTMNTKDSNKQTPRTIISTLIKICGVVHLNRPSPQGRNVPIVMWECWAIYEICQRSGRVERGHWKRGLIAAPLLKDYECLSSQNHE